MPFKSYGGYVWTSQEPQQLNPDKNRAVGLTAMAVLAAGTGYAATRDLPNGFRPVDYLAGGARLGGNLSSFQLLNTFRVPEILSPVLSTRYRSEGVADFGVWGREFLESDSTFDWLRHTTGLSVDDLRQAGITRGMIGDTAQELRWSPIAGTSRGRLESVLPSGERRLLSQHVSMLALNEEVVNPFTDKRGLNRFAAGVFAASGMYDRTGFNERDVFARAARMAGDEVISPRAVPSFIPIPSLAGPIGSLGDFNRRSTWLRGIPAFEMGRFNQLLSNVSEQFLGDTGVGLFNRVLGVGPGVRPGPASAMFARYGLAAAGAGAVIMGMSQLDWFRRDGLAGQVAASAATSAGLSYGLSRLGTSSRTAMFAGVASFFGQTIMPGFDQGLIEGLATTGVNADIVRANPLNPANYYRRTLEGFAPGISDWKTGALLAAGALTAASLKLPGMQERLNVKLARATGFPMLGEAMIQNRSIRDIFYENVGRELNLPPENTRGFFARGRLLHEYHRRAPENLVGTRRLNQLWFQSEEQFATTRRNNPLNSLLVNRLRDINTRYAGPGMRNAFMKEVSGFTQEAVMNFFGADLTRNRALLEEARDLGFGRFGPTTRFGRLGALGLGVFMAHQLVTGGLLGSMETSSELKDIYSGNQLVEVKKSRWWEAGGTPFEGGQTSYFRPHAYALMMNRVREKGIWGEDEDSTSPIMKFLRKNFTYDLERQNYWNRPYPISSAAFSDVPIIGGILSSTIGSLIKPARLMHVNEWMRENERGDMEFANVFRGAFIEPAYSLGATGTGKPISPFAPSVLGANAVHQFRELEGMTGWAKDVAAKAVFGEENWSTDQARLATSGEMTSWLNMFWESQTGGALFSNEFLRRILPRKQADNKQYNPLLNSMPSWLPDKFHYGDPFRLVEWGEARMPGPGFAALHPELRGIDPEAYPLLYKYQILSDVAPLTPEFFNAQKAIYGQRQKGMMTEREIAWIDKVDANRSKVVNKYTFDEYDKNAIRLPGSSLTRGIWGGLSDLIRDISAPAEYMVPMGFRPVQKLTGGRRDAIEQYEFERLYGTSLAFWDEPMRDWFRPSFYSALHLLGYDGKPAWRQEADTTNAYFDKLEFIKYMGLADQAAKAGDGQAAAQYRWQASQTRVGVNPMGAPLSIYWSLQAEERPFFNAFMQAGPQERGRILEMVPADQRSLYQTLWSRIDSGDPSLYGTSTVMDEQYMANKLTKTYDEMSGYPMPKPDWIGWHQDVDMSDVQVRYVDRLGADLHDYGLWESDMRKSQGQPFLEGAEEPFFGQPSVHFGNIRSEIYNMLGDGLRPPKLSFNSYPGNPTAQITYNDTRDNEMANHIARYRDGY